jgi:hypothetical protein
MTSHVNCMRSFPDVSIGVTNPHFARLWELVNEANKGRYDYYQVRPVDRFLSSLSSKRSPTE